MYCVLNKFPGVGGLPGVKKPQTLTKVGRFLLFFLMSCSGHRVDISGPKIRVLLASVVVVRRTDEQLCITVLNHPEKEEERESRDWIDLSSFSGDRICFKQGMNILTKKDLHAFIDLSIWHSGC